ncbi:MAG TPA: endonuclease III [Candidatus Nanoarchaeia archaeon]|nr:endonuclease III [Candidatus Nanoarchaeia archaeon]
MNAPPKHVLQLLHQEYPHLTHYLNFSNPLELLAATILSAQVRDEMVNKATIQLFAHYKTAKDYAAADVHDIISIIKSITFANNKAKYIVETCKILVEKYHGEVPRTMSELTELPGIGRKTANAILQNAFGIVEGIVVDTHVLRMSYRLAWSSTPANAEKTEKELAALVPKHDWKNMPGLMKRHGRAICKAPTPMCTRCVIEKYCPKVGVNSF